MIGKLKSVHRPVCRFMLEHIYCTGSFTALFLKLCEDVSSVINDGIFFLGNSRNIMLHICNKPVGNR